MPTSATTSAASPAAPPPLLRLRGLSMRFGGLAAVSSLDFDVARGSISSIIGPNGAGKTTVFNAVTGIYEPTAGTIELEGRQLRRPFSWRVALACALVGLVTAAAATLIASDVDGMFRAAVKHNAHRPDRPFTYASALRDAWAWCRGDLLVERRRRDQWRVATTDGQALESARDPSKAA
jgi:branched-chain amino acid transport system ATP-binding protein